MQKVQWNIKSLLLQNLKHVIMNEKKSCDTPYQIQACIQGLGCFFNAAHRYTRQQQMLWNVHLPSFLSLWLLSLCSCCLTVLAHTVSSCVESATVSPSRSRQQGVESPAQPEQCF